MVVLGAGLAGTVMTVGGFVLLSVTSVPLVTDVDPDAAADVDPVHDDEMLSAVSASEPVPFCVVALLMSLTLLVVVTEPVEPSEADVCRLIPSDVKSVPGPYATTPVVAVADCGLFEASPASATVGVGPTSGWWLPMRLMPKEW
jgi:hypothetical protein